MDDILSQIIAYAPDKIDTELKAAALVQGSRNMDQEPRMQFNNGLSVDPERDSFKKISNVIGAYNRYRRGEKNPALNFNQFFELYSTENFATGGSAGQLVQNTVDGSRPGYSGDPLKEYKMTSGGRRLGVTVEGGERVASKIMKYIYKDKATGKEIEVFKVKITDQPSNKGGKMKSGKGGNYKTLLSKEFSTLEEAVESRDDYYKENPGKRVVDPTKKSEAKKKRRENEKLAGGDERFKQGNKEIQKGHSTNIEGKNKIKPKNIIYTPTDINSKMGGKAGSVDAKNPSSLDSLDLKQRNTENEIEKIKKSKLPDAEKKRLLAIEDNKLMKYVAQSDGYKTAVLSDGGEYGTNFRSLQSQDMFNEFPNMTEKQVKEFVGEYFTQKGDLKPKYKNAKDLPQSVQDNIVKAYTFNENVKNAQTNATKSKQVASLLEKLGCGKSAGGRIKFNKGTTCAIKGREILEKGLKNGFKKSDVGLAQKILGSGKFLKDMVSLRGLFGPAALAFTALTEAGFVASDAISGGKSFREAIGDSAFNYLLGDKTKINSEEEFIKRLKNIPGSPSQGFRGVTDEDIGKMQYFKESLKDMGVGFKNYNAIKDIEARQQAEKEGTNKDLFSENAFELEAEKNKLQADNQDYFRTNTGNRVSNYLMSDAAAEAAEALQKSNLMAEQDQLNDAYRSSLKGIESLKKEKSDIAYELSKMNNPTKPTGYEVFSPAQMSYIMSNIKDEPDNNYGLFGPAELMEGGIASLNVKK